MKSIYNMTENFNIAYCEKSPGGSMPYLHTHNTYEIYYLHQGRRSYIINNKVYELTDGSVALIPPNVFHKTTGDKFTRTLINFSHGYLLDFFSENAVTKLLSCFRTSVIFLPPDERELFKKLCLNLSKPSQKCGYDEQPLLLANILNVLNRHSRKENYEPKNASNRLLAEILDYIGKNYTDIENLEEIANKFYITKYHLCRIFKEATGMTVFQYLTVLKIQKACTMLSEGTYSITDICSECRFNSQAYFNKVFIRQIGMKPREYKKKFKEQKL